MSTIEENVQLVKDALNALNTGDITKVSEFISPTYFNHESQMDPVRSKMRRPQEFIDTVINIRKAFSDLRYNLLETVVSSDKVVSIVSVMGKHTGSFFGFIPPSGNNISYRAVHVFTIGDDGKITEHKAIRDDLALMYQLGVVKATTPQYQTLLEGWKGVT
jgi:predicted ester cyclase